MLAEVSACHIMGGASRMLREQAGGLKQRGHNVCLLVRAPQTDAGPQAVFDDITEFRYSVCRKSAPAFVLSSIFQSIRIFDRIKDHCFRPDVVIINQSLAGFGPILFRRKHAPAWVYQCFSLAHEEYLTRNIPNRGMRAGLLYALHAKMRFWIEHWTMRLSTRVIVLSQFMKERVIAQHHIPPEKIYLVPAAADISRFRPRPDKKSLRAEMRLPEDRVILFTVRNLVPRMGLENLIRAMAMIGKTKEDLLLIIGGTGALKSGLQQLIHSLGLDREAVLIGFIPESDLAAYYQCADLVVMPTHALEGFGLVTVEALACGTPVLGTPVAAIPEILSQIDPCLIAEGSDADSLAKAIRNLVAKMRHDPAGWIRLSRQGRQLAEDNYNWAKHCERLERILGWPGSAGVFIKPKKSS